MAEPAYLYEPYRATLSRAPRKPLIFLPETLSERTGPLFGPEAIAESSNDLTRQHAGEPLGERIIVTGRVSDDGGRPVPHTLVEIWQTNSAGRYFHNKDSHSAPLDPNFTGAGRALTDANGCYRFLTIKPGAYPWRNHDNAWRPAHIHFSLFGPAFSTRLITQMYFPGDPLLAFDPDRAIHPRRSGTPPFDRKLRLAHHRARVGARLPFRHRAARPRCDTF